MHTGYSIERESRERDLYYDTTVVVVVWLVTSIAMQKFAFIFDLIEFLTVGSVWYLLFFLINQLSITAFARQHTSSNSKKHYYCTKYNKINFIQCHRYVVSTKKWKDVI